jgi:DNA invertase Pin-like site-specific DNA recombinase
MGRSVGRTQARREYLDALDALDDADRQLRAQLGRARRNRALLRKHLANGGAAAGCGKVLDVRGATNQFDGAVGSLLAERRRAQKAMYQLSAAEGMTATEIARTWGVSRQFVSRILNGARGQKKKVGGPGSRVGS